MAHLPLNTPAWWDKAHLMWCGEVAAGPVPAAGLGSQQQLQTRPQPTGHPQAGVKQNRELNPASPLKELMEEQ